LSEARDQILGGFAIPDGLVDGRISRLKRQLKTGEQAGAVFRRRRQDEIAQACPPGHVPTENARNSEGLACKRPLLTFFTEAGRVPMIAPAMKTRQQEALRYVELAQRGARVERVLGGQDLPRWSEVISGDVVVEVALTFWRDEASRPCVKGSYRARAEMLCRRCSEVLPHELAGEFELTIVRDDASASMLGGEHDVLVAEREVLDVAEILEDELLMAMPDKLCREDPCERMLPRNFPPPGGEVSPALERDNPFAAIGKLKD
jgi:uncharacterized protein